MNGRNAASRNTVTTQVVLIANGDATARASVRSAFDTTTYEVHESEDGAEALGKALCHKPGLIIAESQLRRIDGLALCRLLRSDPTTRTTPIILIANAPYEVERMRSAGADHVLDGHCSPEAVASAARELLDRGWTEPSATDAVQAMVGDAAGRRPDQRGFGVRNVRREQTTNPPRTPPPLICPVCQAALVYQHSHTGGVNARTPEQWDYYECPTCGPYQYRQRTRKLKST
jgi:CheY-like chemotaxis protein